MPTFILLDDFMEVAMKNKLNVVALQQNGELRDKYISVLLERHQLQGMQPQITFVLLQFMLYYILGSSDTTSNPNAGLDDIIDGTAGDGINKDSSDASRKKTRSNSKINFQWSKSLSAEKPLA